MPWRIELLGGLKARQGEQVVVRFGNQKGAALLAYLAYYRTRAHAREALAELLWPETPPEVGRHNLRQALLSVRRQLEPEGAAEVAGPVFLAHRAEVQLSPAVTTDVAEFEAGLKAAAGAPEPATRAAALVHVVELYQGPLLPGFYDAWVLTERERLAEACIGALRQLEHLCREAGEEERAVEYARRAVAVDPLNEAAHCNLMRLLIAVGRPAEAQRQFQELERLFEAELGSPPSAEAAALVRDLAAGRGAGRSPGPVAAPSPGTGSRPAGTPAALLPSLPQEPAPTGGAALAPRLLPVPGAAADAASLIAPLPASLQPRLPAPVTRFFGREEELEQVGAMLQDPATRLITLTGAGGAGKTRLAIETARRAAGAFGAAVWFVPLADRADAHALPYAIAEALQLPGSDPAPPLERVVAALNRDGGAPALLVLDNFEHLIEDGAMIVASLIGRAPGLTCLVTSRQRLEIAGEQEFPVSPLPVPGVQAFGASGVQDGQAEAPEGPDAWTPERLAWFPSVALFVDRARAARPDFAVTARNAAAVAQLCERLEGIPLALELAAARAQMLTPSQMLMQLDARFDFLVSRRRDIAPRHRTLRAAFGWSYELLSPELRRFFARLSVFQGRWTLDAAEAVCGESGVQAVGPSGLQERSLQRPNARTPERPTPVLDYLTELRERSLILVTGEDEEERGYRMLETLREFAAEQLAPEEQAALRRRHAEYYLAQAERAAPHLHGPEQSSWLDRLDAEHDNFRAALAWGLEAESSEQRAEGGEDGQPSGGSLLLPPAQIALRLAERLHFFWNVRGYVAEGRRWLGDLLATPDGREPTSLRAAALYGAAVLAATQNDFQAACRLYEESLSIRRASGELQGIADLLCQWGYAAEQFGERAAARALFAESREICLQSNDRGCLAHVLKCTGEVALAEGDGEQARARFEESLSLYRELGDTRGVAMMLGEMAHLLLSREEDERAAVLLAEHVELSRHLKDRAHTALALRNLGYVARHRGEHRTARQLFLECLALWRELGERSHAVELLACLCSAAWHEGDAEAARGFKAECLSLLRGIDDPPVVAACLELLAEVAVIREQAGGLPAGTARRAARLLAVTARLRETKDSSWWWPAERAASERCAAAARAALGDEAFAAASTEGRLMSVKQALEEVRHLDL